MVVKGGKQNEKETASIGLSGKRKKKQPVAKRHHEVSGSLALLL